MYDDNTNAKADPDPFNQPEEIDVQTEVKLDVKEEEDDDKNSVTADLICNLCGTEMRSKICDMCGKTFDRQKALTDHKRQHKKIECEICFKKFPSNNIKRHRSICCPKVNQEHSEQHKCLFCDFSSNLELCFKEHIKEEHEKSGPV